jgi:hypothetical protein
LFSLVGKQVETTNGNRRSLCQQMCPSVSGRLILISVILHRQYMIISAHAEQIFLHTVQHIKRQSVPPLLVIPIFILL